MHFETQAIRIQTERTSQSEHSTPLFPTSSFVFDHAEDMAAKFRGDQPGNIYSRFTNPNCRELELKMAALEQMEDAFATASGMSAIFACFASFLQQGNHILVSRAVFGSTYNIVADTLPKWGIEFDWIYPGQPSQWELLVKPNTQMIFIETPSNPGLEIFDLSVLGQFAHNSGLMFVVDNCFATPYLQKPVLFGADISVHSATKYIDGQGRVLGGVVCGKQEYIDAVRSFCRRTGPSLSPFNAWILSKSLETLAVRMDRHTQNALALATFLEKQDEVQKVIYPFLSSHPRHDIAKAQMKAGGGIVSFEVKGSVERGARLLNHIEMCSLSANLGDTRTIITHPSSTTHSKIAGEDRLAVGITDQLVRVSVGLENIQDIIQDIENALKKSS